MFFQIKKVLRSWMDVDRLDLRQVAELSNSIDFFKEMDKRIVEMHWTILIMKNINILQLINPQEDIIGLRCMSENPGAISIINDNIDNIDFTLLSSNPAAIHIIKNNLDKNITPTEKKNETRLL
jgi:hypothetical protein